MPLVPGRRRIAFKTLGIFGGATALVLAVAAFQVSSSIDRQWNALRSKVAELADEGKSFDPRRPPVLLPAVPGNAWEDYSEALHFSAPILKQNDQILYKAMGDRGGAPLSPEDCKAVDGVLDRLGPGFRALSRAARRGESRAPYDWDHLTLAGFSEPSPFRWNGLFASTALLQVRRLMQSGEADEALHLMLAVGQFGHDQGENGVGSGTISANMILGETGRECRNVISTGNLNDHQLSTLARGLEVLERSFIRDGRSLRNDVLACGAVLLREERIERDDKVIRPTWRHGYSTRALGADAFFRALGWVDRFAQADALPYGEELKIRIAISAEAEQSHNGLSSVIDSFLGQCSQQREWLTQVRVARIAVHYRLTGNVLNLPDPWGGRFQFIEEAGTLRVLWKGASGQSFYEYFNHIEMSVPGPGR
jgi:hypothetical protein